MKQNIDLSGKTALITGASNGIGLAAAQTLADYGASVVLAARSQDKLDDEARRLRAQGKKAYSVVCDVSDYESFSRAIEFARAETGALDMLVNNAGVIEPLATLVESDPVEWAQSVDVNYKGVYYGMRAAIPHMLEQNSGTIINLSSGAASRPVKGWSHYCSSKAAAKMLTQAAHLELEGSNIAIIGLSPGTVATPMMKKIKEAKINPISHLDWSVHIPPEWVAQAIAYLCTEAGHAYSGTDFSLKTNEGRSAVGLPLVGEKSSA